MNMSDIWGWDAIPQTYGSYDGFTLNGIERKGNFYGLLFCTEEAAEAVSHAVKSHDHLTKENAELREAIEQLVDYRGILTSDNEVVVNAKQLLNKTEQ